MSGKRVNCLYVLIGIIYLFGTSSADTPQAQSPTPQIATEKPAKNDNSTARISRVTISPVENPEINRVGNSSLSANSSEDNFVPKIHLAAFDAERSYAQNLSLETAQSTSQILTDFTFRETAGFVTIGFLLFSMFGYIGFVSWRRYLQNKYGNGQTLITEEMYDVSDLRNFEI